MRFLARLSFIVTCVLTGAVAATLYGIVNDQVTVTVSPEYFSVFKHRQFLPLLSACGMQNGPVREQAVLVGSAATWWFGMILGAVIGLAGSLRKDLVPGFRQVVWAVLGVLAAVAICSILGGVIGFLVEPAVHPTASDWPFLDGISHIRAAFAVGAWHDAAYGSAVLATIVAAALMRRVTPGIPEPAVD